MEKRRIEYVCTANNGRSPLAETMARAHLKLNYRDFLEGITISSSGTDADISKKPIDSFKIASYLIGRGHNYNLVSPDLYSSEERGLVEKEILKKDDSERYEEDEIFRGIVNNLATRTLNHFQREEVELRDEFLRDFGLIYEGRSNKQTKVSSDISLILPMAQSNAEKIREIYRVSSNQPRLEVISDYSGTDPILNSFGSPHKEEHIEAFKLVKKASEMSIDRFVREIKWI